MPRRKQEEPLPQWRCPKCGDVVEALGIEVAHRCPQNKSKMTDYLRVSG